MLKRFTLAALCAACAHSAIAGLRTSESPMPSQMVSLKAVVEAGTTTACGMREAPHLIEHLLLSNTEYGDTPVDAILRLREERIKLSAFTHSDFTEYTLSGPADKAEAMSKAMVTFLSRSSLPRLGFEREKKTIIREVRAESNYTSAPTLYERFIAAKAGGRQPCAADSAPFATYDFNAVQSAFRAMYQPENIRIVSEAEPGTFDLDAIASALPARAPVASLSPQHGKREQTDSLDVVGRNDLVEMIFPIAGRKQLSHEAANAIADQARLEVQAHIRRTYQLYTARSFVDQSLDGGWIRLEVPHVANDKAQELLDVASAAMAKVDIAKHKADPIWRAYGSHSTASPVGEPVVALAQGQPPMWLKALGGLQKTLASWWAWLTGN